MTVFVACNKDNDTLTSKEKQAIISSYNTIDALVSDFDVENSFEHLKNVQTQPMVEKAYFENSILSVKFEKGGYAFWDWTPTEVEEEQGKAHEKSIMEFLQKSTTEVKYIPNNKDVRIINAHYGEAGHLDVDPAAQSLKNLFDKSGFNAKVINGQDASVSFFLNNLNKYGVIIFFGHGSYDENSKLTWLQIGEKIKAGMEDIQKYYLNEWTRSELAIYNGVISISNRAIENSYEAGSFPNSLIYLSACSGLKSTSSLAKAFTDRGAGVVIGWTGVHRNNAGRSLNLFSPLLDGKTVEKSFELVPWSDLVGEDGARLIFYPNNDKGKNMGLIKDENPNGLVIEATNIIFEADDPACRNIKTVKAAMFTEGSAYDFIATANYENGGFKLTLPGTINDEYLHKATDLWGNMVSDNQAKITPIGLPSIYGCNGDPMGNFYYSSANAYEYYVYADRDFTINGIGTLNKGWNRLYATGETFTIQKPSGMRWHYTCGR